MSRIIKINPDNPDPNSLQDAAEIINAGGVIGYPTETVYGLGAGISNSSAVERIFKIKGRDFNKALIVIVNSIEMLQPLVQDMPPDAESLMNRFWPGPLTLVFKASPAVNPAISGGRTTIAIRIPDNRICLELLSRCDGPITSTSANIAGEPNSITAMEVEQKLGRWLDLIIDGGASKSSSASTLLDLTTELPKLRRKGAIPANEIERMIKIESE
ncbi:threonylcarbamoyl-AMP synthase [candidate division KSB1 bacterium]|nr:threonylcarbamoyl-AMP synthase [candidate division KSB1 bacterium]